MSCNCGNCQWDKLQGRRGYPRCDRCGIDAQYCIETFNPVTEELHILHFCGDCQMKADALLSFFLEVIDS